jgi:hypothetical protein
MAASLVFRRERWPVDPWFFCASCFVAADICFTYVTSRACQTEANRSDTSKVRQEYLHSLALATSASYVVGKQNCRSRQGGSCWCNEQTWRKYTGAGREGTKRPFN